MKAFLAAALSRKAAVLLVLALSTLWGTMAYLNIAKESTPDVKIPILYISATHEGISPEDSERLIIRPLEQQLKSLDGVSEMRSTSFEGGGYVLLEFASGYDIAQARVRVREKVDAARAQLPASLKDPTINEVNLSLFPVLVIKLSGQLPARALYRLARDLRDRVETSVPAVLKADIVGMRDDAVEILIDPTRIQSHALSFESIMRTFTRNNQLISAGNLDNGNGSFGIKVPSVFATIADIMSIPIANNGDASVRLTDVADVRRTFKDPQGFAYDGGQPAVAIEVTKRTGENLIETIASVKSIVAEQQQSWPAHVNVAFSHDQSKHIHEMLAELQNSLILAIILVVGLLGLTLGWRQALLVGIAV
ncbi:MAG: efflux RND transporter permease subunit, partial [Alphaproteobacteria bacterium]